ncbi:hypothetical protein [Halomonas sp.]|uniref:hypothetical protein n=1 Tax=Halomonas sp. TaxID=1486246 RepID=UPI0035677DDE
MKELLARLLGKSPTRSTADVQHVDRQVYRTEGDGTQCEHTEVEEVDEVYPLSVVDWRVKNGYLVAPQTAYHIIRCKQCGRDLSWDEEKAESLAFKADFVIDADIDIDEALNAMESGASNTESESILINRSENPEQSEE